MSVPAGFVIHSKYGEIVGWSLTRHGAEKFIDARKHSVMWEVPHRVEPVGFICAECHASRDPGQEHRCTDLKVES